MKKFKIALVPGDGVGQEVVDAARKVMEVVAQKGEVQFEFTNTWPERSPMTETKDPLPPETMEGMRKADATLMGAMSTGLVPPPSPMGRLRKELDLYADLRPDSVLSGGVVSAR